MTKVKFRITKEDAARVDQDASFELPPVGIYVLTCNSVDAGFSKTDGEEDKSKPRLQYVYSITGEMPGEREPSKNYGNLWDYVSFSAASGWKRAEVLYAFGFISKEEADNFSDTAEFEVDTDEFVERKVLARIKHEKGQTKEDPKRAKIAKLLPYGSDVSSLPSLGETPVYGDGDEAFGSDGAFASEPESGETETEALLTESELQEMELKELGDLAKEFDLEPNDFVVKNRAKKVDLDKTKEAIIVGILTAQNGEPEAETTTTDESPF